jgi:TolB-like protein/AraC-like DNA-binding protein
MNEALDKDQKFIRKLTEITLANLRNENFGVSELALESGMSQYFLRRRLNAITNKTPNQFISEIRLRKALEMLQSEEINASEVAYKVGFSSPAYFNKCFHEFFGYPPGKVSKGSLEIREDIKSVQVTARQGKKKTVRLTFILVSSLFLAVSVILIYNYFNRVSEEDLEKSIAVLPFKNLSDSLTNQYFIDGLMEEVLTDLCRIHDLRVISRSSVEQFRQSNKSTPEIAKILGVNYIVEGSGQKYGNTFRLRVQLIRAKGKEAHLWARSYEQEIRETKDIFTVQSEIAQSVAAELKATITPFEKQMIEKIPTKNLTAYDFYRRGREEHWFDYFAKYNSMSRLYLKKAENLYNKALENDSAFALAYAGLAKVYWDKYYNESETYFTENYLDSVLILCNIALSYDDQLADAHTLKGKYYRNHNHPDEALSEFDKANNLNPNDWMACWEKGDLYFWQNDFIHSLGLFEKVISLYRGEELSFILQVIGKVLIFAGFPDKAYYYSKEALDLDGDSCRFYYDLSMSEFYDGNFNKSVKYGEKASSLDSIVPDSYGMSLIMSYIILGKNKESLKYLNKCFESCKVMGRSDYLFTWIAGYIYLANGDKIKADYYLEESLKESYKQLDLGREYTLLPYAYYDLASIYAFRGERDKAFENLRIFSQKNCDDHEWSVFLNYDPLLNSIRNEPEFQKIVRDVDAKYQANHERVRKWLEEKGEL